MYVIICDYSDSCPRRFVGMFSGEIELTYPIKPGDWTLQVDAFVSTYQEYFYSVGDFLFSSFKLVKINPVRDLTALLCFTC